MMEAFQFTVDWFGGHIPVWQAVLGHLAGRPDVAVLEVGSYEGRSAIWLLGNILTHPSARLDCVDIFFDPGYEGRFDHNIRAGGCEGKVRKLKGPSQEVLRGLPLYHYDAVYLDGSHEAPDTIEDAILGFRLLKPGGILIFDDYHWQVHPDPLLLPKMAIDAFLTLFQRKLEVLHQGYQVILRKL